MRFIWGKGCFKDSCIIKWSLPSNGGVGWGAVHLGEMVFQPTPRPLLFRGLGGVLFIWGAVCFKDRHGGHPRSSIFNAS